MLCVIDTDFWGARWAVVEALPDDFRRLSDEHPAFGGLGAAVRNLL
jgi:hypothetical protein